MVKANGYGLGASRSRARWRPWTPGASASRRRTKAPPFASRESSGRFWCPARLQLRSSMRASPPTCGPPSVISTRCEPGCARSATPVSPRDRHRDGASRVPLGRPRRRWPDASICWSRHPVGKDCSPISTRRTRDTAATECQWQRLRGRAGDVAAPAGPGPRGEQRGRASGRRMPATWRGRGSFSTAARPEAPAPRPVPGCGHE